MIVMLILTLRTVSNLFSIAIFKFTHQELEQIFSKTVEEDKFFHDLSNNPDHELLDFEVRRWHSFLQDFDKFISIFVNFIFFPINVNDMNG